VQDKSFVARLDQISGNLVPAEEGLRSQWGTRPPEKFRGHVSP